MSDDFPRFAHGNRAPRGGNRTPSWWAGLERADLPEESTGRNDEVEFDSPPSREPTEAPHRAEAWSRRRSWLVYLVVAAAAMILILIGVGASSTHTVLAALLVIAAPLGLAALAGSVVVRRSGL